MEGRLEKTRGGRLIVQVPGGVPAATHRLVVQVVSSYLDAFLRTEYGRQLQEGLTLEVTNQGRALLLAHNFRFLAAIPTRLQQLPVDGVLLWGNFRKDVLRAYERMDFPVVLVDRPPADWKMHSACIDNETAARDATRRLIELGHRRIAFIRQIHLLARDVDPDTIERQRGYERALREAGLRVRPEQILNSLANDTPESPSIQSLFAGALRPTAVVAVDAEKAALIMAAARARKVAIPRELSIVCFEEIDGKHPEISGPRTDFREVGRQAALLLTQPKLPAQVRRVATQWCDGKTTAPLRSR
jgi:LacI family transcriptional regulator